MECNKIIAKLIFNNSDKQVTTTAIYPRGNPVLLKMSVGGFLLIETPEFHPYNICTFVTADLYHDDTYIATITPSTLEAIYWLFMGTKG